jgi:hypothetical protein
MRLEVRLELFAVGRFPVLDPRDRGQAAARTGHAPRRGLHRFGRCVHLFGVIVAPFSAVIARSLTVGAPVVQGPKVTSSRGAQSAAGGQPPPP